MKILLPTTAQVLETNRRICLRDGSLQTCLDPTKIESALTTAFYPGSPPFVHGGVAPLAGALCFYLVKAHAFLDGNKRTALAVSASFLSLNGWRLLYPKTAEYNGLSEVIERCGASLLTKEELMTWFDSHKAPL